MKKYFSLEREGTSAGIMIYGDIVSWEWDESDVSSYTLSKAIEGLDAETIDVYINSYGGETAEGLAIYNALRRHTAKVVTHDDGFACSAASLVFMAGDERIMSPASLLLIHNAWTRAEGNADQLRKEADDLETISSAAAKAYLESVTITEDELKALLAAETWIAPQDALEMGFATSIVAGAASKGPSQSVRRLVFDMLAHGSQAVPKASAPLEASPARKENGTLKFLSALAR